MPWRDTADVARHNKAAAKSPAKRRKWKKIANAVLQRTGDDASAIRIANSKVKGRSKLYDGKDAR